MKHIWKILFCFGFLILLTGCGGKGGTVARTALALGAAAAATAALGPIGVPISRSVMESLKNNPSPAAQAQYQAAVAHNQTVEANNAQRNALINQFVQAALGSEVTAEDIRAGDKVRQSYAGLIARKGDEVKYMSLKDFKQKYPDEAELILSDIAQVLPEFRGKSVDQVWSELPAAMHSMALNDLIMMLPNSSWVQGGGQVSTVGQTTSNLSLPLILAAAAGLGLIIWKARK